MTPAPDLPMRERIAEALYNEGNRAVGLPERTWSQVEGAGLGDRYIARADAVLTVLADLPDTAVEAGSKASHEAAGRLDPWLPTWDRLSDFFKRRDRDSFRAGLTAAIAAIKEGKA